MYKCIGKIFFLQLSVVRVCKCIGKIFILQLSVVSVHKCIGKIFALQLSVVRVYNSIKNYRHCTGGLLSIMGDNYSCMFPICSAYRLQEIWHTCNCLICRGKLDLYAERLIYREKECLYAGSNGYFLY